tara:strand:+ start:207 stop:650 length:444 start_codon:yes stop_codon:yes gene_type:complete
MKQVAYERYAQDLAELGTTTAKIGSRSVQFEDAVVLFHDKADERRFLIEVRKSEKGDVILRIRTDGTKPAYRGGVSGCVVEDETGSLVLLHRPERVHDTDRLPLIFDELDFDGKTWSSFAVDDGLPQKLYNYALSRPKTGVDGDHNG